LGRQEEENEENEENEEKSGQRASGHLDPGKRQGQWGWWFFPQT